MASILVFNLKSEQREKYNKDKSENKLIHVESAPLRIRFLHQRALADVTF